MTEAKSYEEMSSLSLPSFELFVSRNKFSKMYEDVERTLVTLKIEAGFSSTQDSFTQSYMSGRCVYATLLAPFGSKGGLLKKGGM